MSPAVFWVILVVGVLAAALTAWLIWDDTKDD